MITCFPYFTVVYADYSSSGRSLQFLEDYINKEVLPAFGDCDCTSAVTGLQSLLYNNESRDLIKSAVNATSDQDEIIFCNNPSDRLAHLFTKTKDSIVAYETSSNSSHNSDNLGKSNVVLFVSNFEPENNIRSWIDGGAIIERIDKNREGFLDLVALEKKLSKYSESNYKLIGLFSGVSRLTGILSDDVATTILLHQYNAISLWDCSDIASSAQMHVNSALPGASKDGLFFNCNKMIGGLQSSSVLIIKKSLIANFKSILNEMVDTVSIVRCGLVMQLKEALGTHIMTRQEKICKQMLAHIRTIPEIVLLAPTSTTAKRIPTMCFLVKHPRGAFLHHRFVVAVLNDIFGIQSSANSLLEEITLGISSDLIKEYEKMLNHEKLHTENLRPGYIRITFPFFMNDAEVGYILEALKMVATEAWKLLPQYEVDEKTGEWRHHSNSLAKERKWLQSIRYNDGRMLFNDRRISAPGGFPTNFADCLQTARNIFNRARKMAQKSTVGENLYLKLDDETEKLRWYMLPGEAHELLLGHSQNVKQAVPIDPNKMFESPSLVDLLTCRTNSLSALDIRRYQKSQSLPATPQTTKLSISPPKCSSPMSIKHQLDTASPPSPIVRFTLGGEVTCATNFGQSPQVSSLIASESIRSRNRCHSWGPNPSPVWPRILGNKQSTRSCSVSSQTDLHLNAECTPEFRVGSSSSDNEDINNYVKGVTKEITDEIKSEIREVISQVEDVLENSESVDLQSVMANITSAEDLKTHDSVSAGDIVEFLKEFSKDLTSEVKSEIREASNAVDEFISPDCTNSRQQENDKRNTKLLAKQRFSDISHETSPKPHDDKHRSESLPSPEHSVRPFHYTGAISKIKSIEPRDASSQDSGINLSFQDDERKKLRNSLERNKFTFDENDDQIPILLQQSYDNHNDSSSATSSPKILKRQSHLIKRSSSELDSDEQPTSVWHNLPKDVWKTAAEVNNHNH
ncbi:CLUMA_CG019101, isoform A [Clunio marinus]|uniref:CLUMA_CG019101, isoform A n=1 Tax=Clunio marinus TaxID=568069 RepID=A0A1J1J0D8_9DIPT|nr:CLUMA_CG019101, isoform A [Clunio marinus]